MPKELSIRFKNGDMEAFDSWVLDFRGRFSIFCAFDQVSVQGPCYFGGNLGVLG